MKRAGFAHLAIVLALLGLGGCSSSESRPGTGFDVDFEKYILSNGLEVVLHIDRSDPIVAVAMTYHVGSAREVRGRTGFAHLFEHLLFLNSENLGPGGLDLLIDKVGGTLNGSTSRDRTNYYEVVPNDALEKVLWAEADKLGFFINTVTEEAFEKERQVVKNEKRQSIDNQPYGHTNYVIDDALYPQSHPYHWQVLGSLEDLDRATLDDVRAFYRTWYVPNNATLVVAGDFDPDQARAWIEKYFGEIPPSALPPTPRVPKVELTESHLLLHEDNFARLPELTLVWETVPEYDPDSYPLETLRALLGDGKTSPFYKVIVEEGGLAPSADFWSWDSELAGELGLSVRAFPDTDLDRVNDAVARAFDRFEQEGFSEADLARVKAVREMEFYSGYNSISSLLGKAFALAQYNIFAGDPGYLGEDIRRMLAVTADDVDRVYRQYIRNHPYVATSFVPQARADLALEGSVRAVVAEEPIVTGREAEPPSSTEAPPASTPSSFDRSIEPPFGPTPSVRVPEIWQLSLDNGLEVYGIEQRELPLVRLMLRFDGGALVDDPARPGAAALVAQLMTEGTASKTPAELENAIHSLGSTISANVSREYLALSVTTLERNLEPTLSLVNEILVEPRWDDDAFERARQQTLSRLAQEAGDPTSIATNTFNQLLYGHDPVQAGNLRGTPESITAMTIEDLRNYFRRAVVPGSATLHVTGDVGPQEFRALLHDLDTQWSGMPATETDSEAAESAAGGKIYFVDAPGAAQSVIRIGFLALSGSDPEYYPASVMNLRLGGMFTSWLNRTLREEKGYTYGASSSFTSNRRVGPFTISTSVRSNVTRESLELILDILRRYPREVGADDLETTRRYLIRSNARAFETLQAKIGMLNEISQLGLPLDYVRQREQIVNDMTLDRLQELAERYVDIDRMVFLVVGDRKTQFDRLRTLGLGDPVLIAPQPPAARP